MNHDPEVIKFVFDVFITLSTFFICFILGFILGFYIFNRRKEYKEFKRVNKICVLNGLPDINSIITETDRWDAIRSAEDKIMQENSYILCRVYREYMSSLEKKSL